MHVLYELWFHYGYPSLTGNGPEDLMSTTAKFCLAVAIYPPLHKWVTREERALRAEMHRKMDHIIFHHPDIPPLPPSPSGDSVAS